MNTGSNKRTGWLLIVIFTVGGIALGALLLKRHLNAPAPTDKQSILTAQIQSSPKTAKVSIDELNSALEIICREEQGNLHRLLWRCHWLVTNTLKGAEWRDVASKIISQFTSFQNGNKQDGVYLIRNQVYSSTNGATHRLLLNLSIGKKRPPEERSIDRILDANVSLEILVNKQCVDFELNSNYPEETILGKLLKSDAFQLEAKKNPVLEKITVMYSHLRNRWEEFNPYGFGVVVKFINRVHNPDKGHSQSFIVNSGLDPFEDWKGMASPEKFVSRDTLDTIEARGSSTWQSGWGHGHHLLQLLDESAESQKKEEKQVEVLTLLDVQSLPATTRRLRIIKRGAYQAKDALLLLKHLEHLESEEVGDADLAIIAQMASLKKLTLQGDRISDAGIALLTKMPQLESIRIKDAQGLTHVSFRYLTKVKTLKSIDFTGNDALSLVGIEQLDNKLRYEALWPLFNASDKDLEIISTFQNIRSLEIIGSGSLTPHGLSQLKKLTNLESISIGKAAIGDDGLASLALIPNLKKLYLYDLPISDSGLLHLAKIHQLTYLYIMGSEKVTDAGLAALQAKLPGKYERK